MKKFYLFLLILLSVNSFGQKKISHPRIYSISCSTLLDDIDKFDGKFISVNLFYYNRDNPNNMGLRYVSGEYSSSEETYERNCACDNDTKYFLLIIPRDIRVPDLNSGLVKVLGKFEVERGNGSTYRIINVSSITRL